MLINVYVYQNKEKTERKKEVFENMLLLNYDSINCLYKYTFNSEKAYQGHLIDKRLYL